jgi:YggT family protein
MILFANFIRAIAQVIDIGLTFFMWVVIAHAILSWVNPDPFNPIVRFINQVTEPLLYQIKKRIPTVFGGIDLSPMIVLLVIFFLKAFIVQSLFMFSNDLITQRTIVPIQ